MQAPLAAGAGPWPHSYPIKVRAVCSQEGIYPQLRRHDRTSPSSQSTLQAAWRGQTASPSWCSIIHPKRLKWAGKIQHHHQRACRAKTTVQEARPASAETQNRLSSRKGSAKTVQVRRSRKGSAKTVLVWGGGGVGHLRAI